MANYTTVDCLSFFDSDVRCMKTYFFVPDMKLHDVGLVVTRQAEDVVNYGRNCLNLFQTTADADPEIPSVPKDWKQDRI